MKNLKTFEEINTSSEPKVGDFVLCEEKDNIHKDDIMYKLNNFLVNNIGKINSINVNAIIDQYQIIYNNIPKDLQFFFIKNGERSMLKSEIKYWSENIEDLEALLQTNKYNL